MQCTYNVTLWRTSLTILMRKQPWILSVVQLHVTVGYVKMFIVAQQCLCGKCLTDNVANFTYQFLKGIIF
jgi:hypothetical protein